MNRPILTCAFLVLAVGALQAQQQQQTQPADPYQGESHPPADDTITAAPPETPAKPPAGKPLVTPAAAPMAAQPAPASDPALVNRATGTAGDRTDNGVVQVAPGDGNSAVQEPTLSTRSYASDPDGDIVHPYPGGPNTLPAGTMIRARLLTLLSTAGSQRGDEFRARVASDVLQDGNVLIPTGAEIDGRVVEVSGGHPGGHGTLRLRPDIVILPDGSRFRLDAQVVGTPGANANVSSEGVIGGGSRWKKDGLEYGGAAGAGAVTGAVIAGPVGAAAGSIIGASLITVHLLTAHPQAVLKSGTVLVFTLNSHLTLTPTTTPGS